MIPKKPWSNKHFSGHPENTGNKGDKWHTYWNNNNDKKPPKNPPAGGTAPRPKKPKPSAPSGGRAVAISPEESLIKPPSYSRVERAK